MVHANKTVLCRHGSCLRSYCGAAHYYRYLCSFTMHEYLHFKLWILCRGGSGGVSAKGRAPVSGTHTSARRANLRYYASRVCTKNNNNVEQKQVDLSRHICTCHVLRAPSRITPAERIWEIVNCNVN